MYIGPPNNTTEKCTDMTGSSLYRTVKNFHTTTYK